MIKEDYMTIEQLVWLIGFGIVIVYVWRFYESHKKEQKKPRLRILGEAAFIEQARRDSWEGDENPDPPPRAA